MTINFKGKEIEFKGFFKSMIMFENIQGESFTGVKGLTEVVTYFYCVLVVSANDSTIAYDDVFDYLDSNPGVLVEFTEWFQKQLEVQGYLKKNLMTKTKGKK